MEEVQYFDGWAYMMAEQMREKGHGFAPQDEAHTVGLLVLVASEIFEAIDVVKKRYPDRTGVGEELADALIRMGHFAATVGLLIGYQLPFDSFNACGRPRVEQFGSFRNGKWATIVRLGRLAGMALDVADGWTGRATLVSERAFCNLFAAICGAAVALDVDLDAAVAHKTQINGQREYGYGLSKHG